jgi:hypothetical protein
MDPEAVRGECVRCGVMERVTFESVYDIVWTSDSKCVRLSSDVLVRDGSPVGVRVCDSVRRIIRVLLAEIDADSVTVCVSVNVPPAA